MFLELLPLQGRKSLKEIYIMYFMFLQLRKGMAYPDHVIEQGKIELKKYISYKFSLMKIVGKKVKQLRGRDLN